MKSITRIGIIDIGSNSVRLVVYEQVATADGYRIIDESKESVRLSEKVADDGTLPLQALESLIDTLVHFQRLCRMHGARRIRTVATAAIRDATNREQVLNYLSRRSGLAIELLAGSEEARLGFLGMINMMDAHTGYAVDIGGGSTELTLFVARKIVHSVSFPFGSVNLMKRFSTDGQLTDKQAGRIRKMVAEALQLESRFDKKELPLIGLGGTVRALGKLQQRKSGYSLPQLHNYELDRKALGYWLRTLQSMTLERRKKLDGLSKRADTIVPGLIILSAIHDFVKASPFRISGYGLRDGLFYESIIPDNPMFDHVVDQSVKNLLILHPGVPLTHVRQVNRIALSLFDDLQAYHGWDERIRSCLYAASLLYRIGIAVHYYQFEKHTYYLLAHSRLAGLSHREILICALSASFTTKKKCEPLFHRHRDILHKTDFELICKLGHLLRLAVALDRSETSPVLDIRAKANRNQLLLEISARHSLAIEEREFGATAKDFEKTWKLIPKLIIHQTDPDRTL